VAWIETEQEEKEEEEIGSTQIWRYSIGDSHELERKKKHSNEYFYD